MFGKIVAISTVKPVSQNYASATGSARVVKSIYFWSGTKYFKRNTADFHKDGYFLQNAGVTKDLRIAFVVCDVNSEQKRLQVKIFVFEKLEGNLTIWRLNWLYAIDQKQRKNRKYAQIHFLDRQINFLCCSGICYASGQFYRNCRVSKNRECSMAAVANKTFPILCFCLGITRTFHPPYTPFATIKNLRYCLVCL